MTTLNHFGQPIGDALPDWKPRELPQSHQLDGRFCRLEPLDSALHSEALFSAWHSIDDNRDWTYFSSDRPATQAECDSLISRNAASQDPLFFAVVDNTTQRAIGSVALMRIDPLNGVAEIGWVNWSPLMKRSCHGTEAIFLLLKYLFDDLQYRRCEWKCHIMNAASNAAAKRFGFQFEGIFRQVIVNKGHNRDTCWYSMLDNEWPQRKPAFEQWLSAENFDAEGQQRKRLEAFRE
ncbi:GNAT family N-acetyltransferase [Ewingella americana]|uniref:N-acetyltransferase n=1 Tax=Ewingella americana TaxID=41202 RepID=A0A502GTK2_9GAMM|nr:GNAT family protein [Ewingella americana]TPG64306.1 N-acetyltransferase [Ewingella americana]